MTTELTEIHSIVTLAAATEALVHEWLEHERGEGASDNTLAAYRRGLDSSLAWLRDAGLAGGSVTPKVVRAYKTDLLKASGPQTVNLQLAALRSFFRFLVSTDRLESNPAAVKGARWSKSRLHKRDALTNGEVLAVIQTCDPATPEGARDRAILTLMAYCGLREFEIHRPTSAT